VELHVLVISIPQVLAFNGRYLRLGQDIEEGSGFNIILAIIKRSRLIFEDTEACVF
jgi:hypothetical protein